MSHLGERVPLAGERPPNLGLVPALLDRSHPGEGTNRHRRPVMAWCQQPVGAPQTCILAGSEFPSRSLSSLFRHGLGGALMNSFSARGGRDIAGEL